MTVRLAKYREAKAREAATRDARYRELAPREAGGGGASELPTLFSLPLGLGSTANLLTSITINGATVTPTWLYEAKNANATNWTATVGDTLTLSAAGSMAFSQGTPLPDITDELVQFDANGKYSGGVAADNHPGTDDFLVEMIWRQPVVDLAGRRIVGNEDGDGWSIMDGGTGNVIGLNMLPGAVVNQSTLTPALLPGHFYHLVAAIDRDDASGIRTVCNGVPFASADPTSAVATLLSGDGLMIGDRPSGSSKDWAGGLVYLAMYQKAAWFAGGAQHGTDIDAFGVDRWCRLHSLRATSAGGSPSPTVYSFGPGTIERYETDREAWYLVGDLWPPIHSHKDTSGTLKPGYTPAIETDNELLWSEDFTNAAWTKSVCTISSSTTACPLAHIAAKGIVGDNVLNTHYVEQLCTSAASEHQFDAVVKAGARTVVKLVSPTVANAHAYFDLSAGTVGTVGAGSTGTKIKNLGNGWYRCLLRYSGAAASHAHHIMPVAADSSDQFTGDGSTVDMWVACSQHDQNAAWLTWAPYIRTQATAITRIKDRLRYAASGNVAEAKGEIIVGVMGPNDDIYPNEARTFVAISDASSVDVHRVGTYAVDAAEYECNNTSVIQAALADTGDIDDGDEHTIKVTYQSDRFSMFVDDVEVSGSPDTSGTPPAGLTVIDVGQDELAAEQPGAVITSLTIKG